MDEIDQKYEEQMENDLAYERMYAGIGEQVEEEMIDNAVKCLRYSRKVEQKSYEQVERERPAEQMDDDIQTLIDHMLRKLLMNDHKPNWIDYTDKYIFECLKVEVDELEEALILGDPSKIAMELADVANYCMMMISNIKRRVR